MSDLVEKAEVSNSTEKVDEEADKNPWTSINHMLCNNRCFICTQGFPRGKKKKVFMVSQILQSFTAIYATKDQPYRKEERDVIDGKVAENTIPQTERVTETASSTDTMQSQSDTETSPSTSSNVGTNSTLLADTPPPTTLPSVISTDKAQTQSQSDEKKEGSEESSQGVVDEWSLDENSGLDPRLILFINFKEQCPHVWACWQNFFALAGLADGEQRLVDLLADGNVQVWMSGLACCRSDMCAAMYRALTSDHSKNQLIASILASKEKFTHKNTFCPPDCDCDSPWQFMNM